MKKEIKGKCINMIQIHMSDTHDIEMGNLEAELLLENLIRIVGSHYFNEGIREGQKILLERFEQIEEDFYALIKK